MAEVFNLVGKIALVTGASSGLGNHFARLLARHGCTAIVGARRVDRLGELCKAIRADGGRALPVALDVTSTSSVDGAFEAALDEVGLPDILVNNAGVGGPGLPLADMSDAEFEGVLQTNLVGAFRVARHHARLLIAAGRGGSIVNVSSILAARQAGHVGAYASSKAALSQLTQVAALEWARHGIRVNALAPGYIRTEINRAFFATPGGDALVKRIPFRRLGEPDDLDGPLLLLASDAGRYMTGSVVTVDGGHSISSL